MSWQKNTANQVWHFVMKTLASASLAQGVSVSGWIAKDGGAMTTVAGTITSIGQGAYVLSATQADTNFNSGLLLFTGVSCIAVEQQIFTQGWAITGTNVAASATNEVSIATSGLRNNAFTAAALASIAGDNWGYSTRTVTGGPVSIATSGIGNTAFTAAAYTSLGAAVWANSTRLLSADVTVGSGTATFFSSVGGGVWHYPVSTANVSGAIGAKYQPLLRAEITSATSATVVVSTNATAVSNFYQTGLAYIVDGSGSGQPGRLIASYESSGTRRAFTFQTELAVVPNAGAFLELVDGIGYTPSQITISGEVSIATSGIRANSFAAAAFTSIAGGVWGYTGDKSVSVATSGIGFTAFTSLARTSIAGDIWSHGTRLLTAGVTLASMGGLEVSIATSGIRANALTAEAIASIGAGIVASVAGEVSIAPGGINTSAFASGVLPTNFSSFVIDSSGRVDLGALVGVSVAALQMSKSGTQIQSGTVGSGATSVSIPVSSLFPVSVWGSGSFVGRSLVFSVSTETTVLRGMPAAITSSSPTVLAITTIPAAPSSTDSFIIV